MMRAGGFTHKSNLIWHKVRKDTGPDGRGVGFYFRKVSEVILFGVRGKNARARPPSGQHDQSNGSECSSRSQGLTGLMVPLRH